MTYTHVSHFGLKHELTNDQRICFTGSLGNCKRMAAAHGMEVDKYEGAILSCDGGIAQYRSASPNNFAQCWFKGGGMIHRLPDNLYWLSIPIEIWNRETR